jgi:hypothetical protein
MIINIALERERKKTRRSSVRIAKHEDPQSG